MAPLDNPLTLVPLGCEPTKFVILRVVYVWISYKCKSNSDEAFSYAESETPKEYTLASPIFNPVVKMLNHFSFDYKVQWCLYYFHPN